MHKILIVEDDEPVAKALAKIVKGLGHAFIYAPDGASALEKVERATHPFALMIVDQQMPGMTGSEFFEKSREISPDSIRYLMTGFTNMNAIIDSINKGAIHYYIQKPWDSRDLQDIIRLGIAKHEARLENQRLLGLAKEQNAKLLAIGRELKENAKKNADEIDRLDAEILSLSRKLDRLKSAPPSADRSLKEAVLSFRNGWCGTDESRFLDDLFQKTLRELEEQFHEIALRNGFRLPAGLNGEADD